MNHSADGLLSQTLHGTAIYADQLRCFAGSIDRQSYGSPRQVVSGFGSSSGAGDFGHPLVHPVDPPGVFVSRRP